MLLDQQPGVAHGDWSHGRSVMDAEPTELKANLPGKPRPDTRGKN